MLFVVFSFFITIMVIFFFTIVRPMFIFYSKAIHAKEMYNIFYTFFKTKDEEKSIEEVLINVIKKTPSSDLIIKIGEYEITVNSNTSNNKILQDLENILNDALNYGETLKGVITSTLEFKEYKCTLIEMCYQIRMLKWNEIN